MNEAATLWSRTLFTLGDIKVNAEFLVKMAVAFCALVALTHLVQRLIRRWLDRTKVLDTGQKFAIERVAGYVVFGLGFLILIQTLGLRLESLAFLGGAIGIGVGFGLQNIVNNFVSGLILLVERPIKVGDRIEVDGLNGDVVHIAARSTWVRTNDNIVIIVPNSEFVTSRVTNWTANDTRVRFRIPVGVSYSSRPEQVREILIGVARKDPDVLDTPPPDAVFTAFGDSSLDFELRVWTSTRVQTPLVLRSNLYFAIFAAFQEAGIEIPFPQRDVHVKTLPSGAPGIG